MKVILKAVVLSNIRRGVAFLDDHPEYRQNLKIITRRLGVYSSARVIYTRMKLVGRRRDDNGATSSGSNVHSPQAKRILKQIKANVSGN